jgi:SAM-dependent methyltransferase
MSSETAIHRETTVPYLKGNGIDIASGGDPVVPECISIDLPQEEYAYYNSNQPHRGQINLRAHAHDLPFKNNSLDWAYSSHLLEDYPHEDWPRVVGEWVRVLKPGGTLLILVPDRTRWAEALAKGQPPNCQHRYEPNLGDLSVLARVLGLNIVREELLGDSYTIMLVAKK